MIIKSCPFCGGSATIDKVSEYTTTVGCHNDNCCVRPYIIGGIDTAPLIEIWNRRRGAEDQHERH